MPPSEVRAQLHASNLNFLLQYLAQDVPQIAAMDQVEILQTKPSGGGALLLSAHAQKQGSDS